MHTNGEQATGQGTPGGPDLRVHLNRNPRRHFTASGDSFAPSALHVGRDPLVQANPKGRRPSVVLEIRVLGLLKQNGR